MYENNPIAIKSIGFARRIIRIYRYLTEQRKEFILSKQILRSGTSIGANVHEAIRGQSRRDFFAKMNIALKEASETEYWLELLVAEKYLPTEEFTIIHSAVIEIICILVAITKKQKNEEADTESEY